MNAKSNILHGVPFFLSIFLMIESAYFINHANLVEMFSLVGYLHLGLGILLGGFILIRKPILLVIGKWITGIITVFVLLGCFIGWVWDFSMIVFISDGSRLDILPSVWFFAKENLIQGMDFYRNVLWGFFPFFSLILIYFSYRSSRHESKKSWLLSWGIWILITLGLMLSIVLLVIQSSGTAPWLVLSPLLFLIFYGIHGIMYIVLTLSLFPLKTDLLNEFFRRSMYVYIFLVLIQAIGLVTSIFFQHTIFFHPVVISLSCLLFINQYFNQQLHPSNAIE